MHSSEFEFMASLVIVTKHKVHLVVFTEGDNANKLQILVEQKCKYNKCVVQCVKFTN